MSDKCPMLERCEIVGTKCENRNYRECEFLRNLISEKSKHEGLPEKYIQLANEMR